MGTIKTASFSLAMLATCMYLPAQDAKSAIQTKLESQYALTQPTADNTDIVTAGAVLIFTLKGSTIIMSPVSSSNFYQNSYKDGKITQNAFGKSIRALDRFNHLPGVTPASAPSTRTFVPGEKMWVTKIDVKDDGVVFDLFTDAFSDVRYKAALKFPFTKGLVPAPDQMATLVATVFKVQPADDTNTSAKAAPGAGQPAAPPNTPVGPSAPVSAPKPAAPAEPDPPAIIPPPPPPPVDAPVAAPKTVSIGQTPAEVVAIFGQPKKVAKLAAKQIYYYEDLKVTFVNGKVADIQ